MSLDYARDKPFDSAQGRPLVEVRHLVKQFTRSEGFLSKPSIVHAVNADLLRKFVAVLCVAVGAWLMGRELGWFR